MMTLCLCGLMVLIVFVCLEMHIEYALFLIEILDSRFTKCLGKLRGFMTMFVLPWAVKVECRAFSSTNSRSTVLTTTLF